MNQTEANSRIGAWIHSHVQGSLFEVSPVDGHNQYVLEKYASPYVVGIVVEINDFDEEWDVFKWTTMG